MPCKSEKVVEMFISASVIWGWISEFMQFLMALACCLLNYVIKGSFTIPSLPVIVSYTAFQAHQSCCHWCDQEGKFFQLGQLSYSQRNTCMWPLMCWVSADGFFMHDSVICAALVLHLKPRGQGQDEFKQVKVFPHFQKVTSRPPALPFHSGRGQPRYFK